MKPELSKHFQFRTPSAIRIAQIEFSKRTDDTEAINVAIGNVSLPMHPAMQDRMRNLGADDSPFVDGVVKYSATVGTKEANNAFLNIISSSGFDSSQLYSQITDGGSQAMELIILGVCGQAGADERPLLLIDAAYTNYKAMAERLGRKTVSITRSLSDDGTFAYPDLDEMEKIITEYKPSALVVIPYDNPTGHFYSHDAFVELSKLAVKHNMWIISDEAYRELYYIDEKITSIWGISEAEVAGISGRRISIETASKVWNACGLRIGAIVTDSAEFNQRSIAENTANLCPNVIGQYIFGSLAHVSHTDLQSWYKQQREYYAAMLNELASSMRELIPNVIASSPDASIYSVVDVRNIVDETFDASQFVLFCAQKGFVEIEGTKKTLLVSPLAEFYSAGDGSPNPGRTQMRIAFVETPEKMKLVPKLFAELLKQYLKL